VSHTQGEEKTSHISQRGKGEAYAESQNWTVVGSFEDLDVSAIKLSPWDRPDLKVWLSDEKADDWDALIFAKTDRVFRSANDCVKLAVVPWAPQDPRPSRRRHPAGLLQHGGRQRRVRRGNVQGVPDPRLGLRRDRGSAVRPARPRPQRLPSAAPTDGATGCPRSASRSLITRRAQARRWRTTPQRKLCWRHCRTVPCRVAR
jgi:Resolvase, N terminal domain